MYQQKENGNYINKKLYTAVILPVISLQVMPFME